LTVDNIETLFTNFSKERENKLFTICDEIQNFGSAYKSNDHLKTIIMSETLRVEPKGVDLYFVDDCNNYIFTTNNNWPVKIEASDRRFLVLDCNNKYANNKEYFDKILAVTNSNEVSEHFFQFLAQKDLSEWNPRCIPETDLKKELQQNSIPDPIQFMMDFYHKQIQSQVSRSIPHESTTTSCQDFIIGSRVQSCSSSSSSHCYGSKFCWRLIISSTS